MNFYYFYIDDNILPIPAGKNLIVAFSQDYLLHGQNTERQIQVNLFLPNSCSGCGSTKEVSLGKPRLWKNFGATHNKRPALRLIQKFVRSSYEYPYYPEN